ncbi:MAG TPA: hypothetical protein VFR10_02665 [bacterium]|nr:hypothetical protein [bacterium]
MDRIGRGQSGVGGTQLGKAKGGRPVKFDQVHLLKGRGVLRHQVRALPLHRSHQQFAQRKSGSDDFGVLFFLPGEEGFHSRPREGVLPEIDEKIRVPENAHLFPIFAQSSHIGIGLYSAPNGTIDRLEVLERIGVSGTGSLQFALQTRNHQSFQGGIRFERFPFGAPKQGVRQIERGFHKPDAKPIKQYRNTSS